MEENNIPAELEGKVLVAKIGQEEEFLQAFNAATKIAQCLLGWDGMSELMYEIGGMDTIGGGEIKADPKWTKEEHIAAIKKFLQKSYLSNIMEYGEWVTKEEAKKRRRTQEVLYGVSDSEKKE